MSILLIAYELNDGQGAEALQASFDSYPSCARLTETAVTLETDDSVETVFADLSECLAGNDFLYVLTLDNPWTGRGGADAVDWLDNRLYGTPARPDTTSHIH